MFRCGIHPEGWPCVWECEACCSVVWSLAHARSWDQGEEPALRREREGEAREGETGETGETGEGGGLEAELETVS